MGADYRMTVYLGAGDDGKRMVDLITKFGEMNEFRNSKMEFVRHCIRYTLENDKSLRNARP
jgi:hypothetical protein